MKAKKIKPDKMLVKMAGSMGLEIQHETPRKKGESLLDWRRRAWGIPPVTFQPIDNVIVVWRLPPITLSAGGLVIPEEAKSPNMKGVLLAMGPRARDTLCSNGIELGHIVIWGRFAGQESHDNDPEFARHNEILMLKDRDVIGSDDLRVALESGKMRYVQGEDGKHRLAIVEQKKLLPADRRREKLLAVAASTHSPHEAETARKIANQTR